jgi:N-methylhydantoinase B
MTMQTEPRSPQGDGDRDAATLDPHLAVLANRMEGVVRRMQNTLFRTARSGILNTGHDFSCVLLTADCRLLAAAESLPIHTLIGPDLVCQAVRRHHPVLRAGDAFLHNDPYDGNSHAADHCLVAPVVDETGTLRMFVLAKAHQADCGNSRPSTYLGDVKDVYEEGALIFSATRIQTDHKDNDDIIRMCRSRIRMPEQWWGDYLAMVGTVRIGEQEALALGAEIGWDALDRYAEAWFDYSEKKMEAALRRLPSGSATASGRHDPFPGVPAGVPVNVEVTIDAERARVTVDLRDNVDCQPCGLNLTESCSASAALVGIFNSLNDPSVPTNAGSFRTIDIKLRRNCVVGIPMHPFSCSAATTNVADRLSNAVQRAIAQIAPGFGMAETGPLQPPGAGVISGSVPGEPNSQYVNQVHLAVTGGAGCALSDGFLTIIHSGNAGMCRIDSVEVDELHYPMLIHARHLVKDTEGAGAFRGAPSAYVEFGPIKGVMDVHYMADGSIDPALGTAGGGSGGRSQAFKRERDGSLATLPACHSERLATGERIVSISAGGGGYGDPFTRAPEAVLNDVREGLIGEERAADIYGIALTKDGAGLTSIDQARTHELREAKTP